MTKAIQKRRDTTFNQATQHYPVNFTRHTWKLYRRRHTVHYFSDLILKYCELRSFSVRFCTFKSIRKIY